MNAKLLLMGVTGLVALNGCTNKKSELVWNQSFYRVGTQSSPRTADLNGDGILDVVLGVGVEELAPTDPGVMAIDGHTGDLLWQQSAPAHVVGSATFYDITGDGTEDVFIGGRNHTLLALDGKTGAMLWNYRDTFATDPVLRYARFNFYNSTLVPDQNADGYPDLLTVNGGNWDAEAGSTVDRFPGVLMLLDLKTGRVLAADTMPDGRESYMSPLCFTQPGSSEPQIVFGSGGETQGGNLYLTKLSDLTSQRLSQAHIIASESTHGFIAPSVLADITHNGFYDIITMSHAGTAYAIDGQTQATLWKRSFYGVECSSSFAVGQFTGDDTPDFFIGMSDGVWPDYRSASQVMINGRDGSVAYQNSLGCFSLASPVVYDLNDDGYDEVLLGVNDYNCALRLTEDIRSPPSMRYQLVSVDFTDSSVKVIDDVPDFRSIYATPWAGDLDQDGYLDIVYSQNFNPDNLFKFLGMRIKRISTAVVMKKPSPWGGYMGTGGNGLFPSR